jgi:hypothetical protein
MFGLKNWFNVEIFDMGFNNCSEKQTGRNWMKSYESLA